MKKLGFVVAAALGWAGGGGLNGAWAVEKAPWRIAKTEWFQRDEENFERFVVGIGKAKCNTVDQCLKSAANPYRKSDPSNMRYDSDCADLPYFLRAYFAWKEGLPFSHVSEMMRMPGPPRPINYSSFGNKVAKRRDLIAQNPQGWPDGMTWVRQIRGLIASGMFRFGPEIDDEKLFPDFYSVAINREGIRPGTTLYNPNGHVAVVYQVDNDGKILFMDAHPDNSLTRGVYGKKFGRSRAGHGAGFKNWRPIRLEGAKLVDGYYYGGRYTSSRNAELKDFSDEQYFGTARPSGKVEFWVNGEKKEYYEFVRIRMALGDFKYRPIPETQALADGLCQDLKDRVNAVQLAITQGIDKRPHPETLPDNIYGTSGEWEEFSSPSRDAPLRTSFKELRDQVEAFVSRHEAGDPMIDYSGTDLRKDLMAAYKAASSACRIEYTGSDGSSRGMDLEFVRQRLFQLSFDPYDCVERRWGATSGPELATCKNSRLQERWYAGEQRLRNQVDLNYDLKMNFSVGDLERKVPGSGVDTAPDTDVIAYLSK